MSTCSVYVSPTTATLTKTLPIKTCVNLNTRSEPTLLPPGFVELYQYWYDSYTPIQTNCLHKGYIVYYSCSDNKTYNE